MNVAAAAWVAEVHSVFAAAVPVPVVAVPGEVERCASIVFADTVLETDGPAAAAAALAEAGFASTVPAGIVLELVRIVPVERAAVLVVGAARTSLVAHRVAAARLAAEEEAVVVVVVVVVAESVALEADTQVADMTHLADYRLHSWASPHWLSQAVVLVLAE